MLENLYIKNVALIEECQISFGQGLNILTGETGAGKSMVLGSLQFVLGQRIGSSKDFLRQGETIAKVEALFSIQDQSCLDKIRENGIEVEEDGTVVINRSLNEAGKSVCRMNGSMLSLGMLRELTGNFVDIYGQHEHQSLLNPKKHILLLDQFCGEKFDKYLELYQQGYGKIKTIQKQIDQLLGDESQREQKLDILNFQKKEIEEAKLVLGEEEEVTQKKKKLTYMERLTRLLGETVELLYDGNEEISSACDSVGSGVEQLREAVALDGELESYYVELEEIYTRLEDVSRELKKHSQTLEEDPKALEAMEQRLEMIYKIKRKYGGSVEKALEFYEKITQELNILCNSEDSIKKLFLEKEVQEKELETLSLKLSHIRKKVGKEVEQKIEVSLHDMEMKYAKFHISIKQEDTWGKLGKDNIEFIFSANQGEGLKSLAKIASGGEMSRVMLALKAVLVDTDEIETFVFDEIDTGISGRTAAQVGKKMDFIGKKRQILCLTHLPQIAAMADTHFLIEKQTVGDKTTTKVELLEKEASLQEVARLLGSAIITQTTLAAAQELKDVKEVTIAN